MPTMMPTKIRTAQPDARSGTALLSSRSIATPPSARRNDRLSTAHLSLQPLVYRIFALCLLCVCLVEPVAADEFDDIPIIDTHIHLYDTSRAEGVPWPPKNDEVLFRPVLPKDFEAIAKRNNLAATVIVEASVWEPDNQWVLDLTRDKTDVYIGLVGSLEIGKPGFAENFRKYSHDKRYVGIRMRERFEGFFESEQVWKDLALIAEMDQTLDVLMFQFNAADVDRVAKRLPNLKILMNHVAGADINGQPVDEEWLSSVKQAASNPNVYCKISGLFQQSHRSPSPKNVEYYTSTLDALFAAFGPDRLVYGSNWPVSDKGGSYAEYKQIVMTYFKSKGRDVMEKLLYKNALKFYGLPDNFSR